VPQPKPSSSAVLFFMLDVSSSMSSAERQLAKTFFSSPCTACAASTAISKPASSPTRRAPGSSARRFFEASGMGGTMASTGFQLALELLQQRYDPSVWNSYLFYASDGDNFSEDHLAAGTALGALAGGLTTGLRRNPARHAAPASNRDGAAVERARAGQPMSSALLSDGDDVFAAIRQFLTRQAAS
jgi:uncharacterized sporulation protein YeaH/YhbH (DUF444 family)